MGGTIEGIDAVGAFLTCLNWRPSHRYLRRLGSVDACSILEISIYNKTVHFCVVDYSLLQCLVA